MSGTLRKACLREFLNPKPRACVEDIAHTLRFSRARAYIELINLMRDTRGDTSRCWFVKRAARLVRTLCMI